MHKPESIPENLMYKILWDFEREKDNLIPTRKPDLLIIIFKRKKKENLPFCGLSSPSEPQSENQST